MITQRLNTELKDRKNWPPNHHMFGLFQLLNLLEDKLDHLKFHSNETKMIEIGSYMGESTLMFAASGMFKEIHCIDPFKGYIPDFPTGSGGYGWEEVKAEYEMNTRYFDNITLHEDFSYNVVDEFEDDAYDFVYIDGSYSYKDTKRDIELYLPKTIQFIGGQNYLKEFPGVIEAVDEVLGEPDEVFRDFSWIKQIL
jgi:hypothetical protein